MALKICQRLIMFLVGFLLVSILANSVQACEEYCIDQLSTCESNIGEVDNVDCVSTMNTCLAAVEEAYPVASPARDDAEAECYTAETDCEWEYCDDQYSSCLDEDLPCREDIAILVPVISLLLF